MLTTLKKTFYFMSCFLVTLFSFHYLSLIGPGQTVCAQENTAAQQVKSPAFTVKGANITPVKQESVQKQSGQNAPGDQPRISIVSASHNAGEIWEGEDIIHSFKVKNRGKAKLVIKKVKAG